MIVRTEKEVYILGVDGGGSKTEVKISHISCEKETLTISGPSSCKSVNVKDAIENLNKAVFDAIKEIKVSENIYFISSCFGFAGYNNSSKDPEIYRKIVFNNELARYLNPKKVIICNDTRIGLEAGSESKNKIVIIAGTGASCFGINESGIVSKTTGWDYILGDEGSGYQVGLKALKAVMRAYDGRGKESLLSKTILEDLNLKEIMDLTIWAYEESTPKVRIGALAETVCRTAEMGDQVSIDILTEEAEEAVISINSVANRLGFKDKVFDLVFVGGLFKCERYFKNILINKIKKDFPGVNFISQVKNPVEGAIRIAVKELKN
jgi:N-acetylglucosamine kinase-like BadF-type ATPase